MTVYTSLKNFFVSEPAEIDSRQPIWICFVQVAEFTESSAEVFFITLPSFQVAKQVFQMVTETALLSAFWALIVYIFGHTVFFLHPGTIIN